MIDTLDAGVVPPQHIYHLLDQDLVKDTLGTIDKMSAHGCIPLSAECRRGMAKYLSGTPRDSRPKHQFSAGSPEAIAKARAAYQRYRSKFGIPNE